LNLDALFDHRSVASSASKLALAVDDSMKDLAARLLFVNFSLKLASDARLVCEVCVAVVRRTLWIHL